MRSVLTALGAMLAVTPAFGNEIIIPVSPGVAVETVELRYDCEGRIVPVTYINAGGISLAIIEIGGDTVVASNVISGSGAKYAGAQYIWWEKADNADLYDLMQAGEDLPVASCAVRD